MPLSFIDSSFNLQLFLTAFLLNILPSVCTRYLPLLICVVTFLISLFTHVNESNLFHYLFSSCISPIIPSYIYFHFSYYNTCPTLIFFFFHLYDVCCPSLLSPSFTTFVALPSFFFLFITCFSIAPSFYCNFFSIYSIFSLNLQCS